MKELLIEDDVTRQMLPQFQACAAYLKKAGEGKEAILIKFDGDGDGITSGLNILNALRHLRGPGTGKKKAGAGISNYQSPSAVYKLEEALKDLNRTGGRETLFILLDHGANDESLESLALLKSFGHKIVIIDHHPYAPKARELADVFVSPMLYTAQGASYATGLLAYEVARRMVPQEAQEELAWFALQADKSRFRKPEDLQEPIALDYLVHYGEDENKLEFYENALSEPNTLRECFEQAEKKVRKALDTARRICEFKKCGPYTAGIFRMDKCVAKDDYPSKSKLISEFQQTVEKERPDLVSIGVAEDTVSFRASKKALADGFDASALIKELKKSFGSEIYSGGGHAVAASLKANPPAIHPIVADALKLMEKKAG